MARKRYGPEQIIPKLREAEVALAKGKKVPLVCKSLGISEQTYHRWRREYGGLRLDQAKRLKELEKENTRLKKLLAEAELDKAILKEAASGNFSARRSDAKLWSRCGMLWDESGFLSGGLARFWGSPARPSVANGRCRTMSHGWYETWSVWPHNMADTAIVG